MTKASDNASVLETAHWVASFRALESTRADALFHDPLARRLIGSGRAPSSVPAWPMIARTKLIDEFIETAVRGGVDCVINLAAGLDTRPYRLDLPRSLRWVEADFPKTIDDKERVLAADEPRGELSRSRVDLADARARDEFLSRAAASARNALVLTEGFLVYLDEAVVRGLVDDVSRQAPIRHWVTDLASPGMLRMLKRMTDAHLRPEERMKFGPAEGVAFFERAGWRAARIESMARAARRFGRAPLLPGLFSFLPDPNPRQLGRRPWGAVVQLVRS